MPDAVLLVKFYLIDFLPILNFLSDPLIYGMRMREIRRAYRRLLMTVLPCTCCWGRGPGAAEQHPMSTTGFTDATVVAMTTRVDSSTALERQAERNRLDSEFSVHE